MPIRLPSLLVCFVLAVLTACAFFHTAQAQPLPERVVYSGQVLDAAGRPIGGAQILLRRQNEQGTMAYWGGVTSTDARGNFSFTDAESGAFYLNVEATGFAPIQNQMVVLAPSEDAGQAGGSAKPIIFRLQEMSTLRARVLDAAGAALKEKSVALLLRPVQGQSNAYPRLNRLQTDGSGDIVFAGLLPGHYDILAVVAGAGYVENKDVDIAPGGSAPAFSWRLSPGGKLKINVRDKTAKGIGGAQVTFSRAGDTTPDAPRLSPGPEMQLYAQRAGFGTRDGDGGLEINDLAPGRYAVSVRVAGAEELPTQSVEITGGSESSATFDVAAPTGVTQQFLFTDIKGAPVADTDVVITLLLTAPAAKAIAPVNPALATGTRIERRARTNDVGSVTVYPLPPGKYQLTARRESNVSAALLPAQNIEIADGAPAITVKVQ